MSHSTPQASIRLLRVLLAANIVLAVGAATASILGTKAPDGPFTSTDAWALAVGLPTLIAFIAGVVGLWLTKPWGRIAFGMSAVALLLPMFNDPAGETKLSLSLSSADMLLTGLILGLVFFAMHEQFAANKSRDLGPVFS